jgi:hypothetical protein
MSDVECCSRALLEQKLAHERELTDAKFAHRDEALRLQAIEYSRRLEDLNHAHARALEAQAHTVSSELYESHREDIAARFKLLSDQMAAQDSRIVAIGAKLATWGAAGMAAIALVGIAAAIF